MNKKIMSKKAFSLIEMMVVVVLTTMVSYGVYVIMASSADAYQISTAEMDVNTQAQKAMVSICSELRESNINNITGFPAWEADDSGVTIDLVDDQAIVFSSARDALRVFHTHAQSFDPDWQAIIVYCPYKANGVEQLRRYQVFGDYDFPAGITNVSATQITVLDASGTTINIDRDTGAPGAFNVLANYFDRISFTGGNPVDITITNEETTKKSRDVSVSFTSSAVIKN